MLDVIICKLSSANIRFMPTLLSYDELFVVALSVAAPQML